MRLNLASLAALSVAYFSGLVAGTDTSDTCAEVSAPLKVPQPLIPKNLITVGNINACICISGVSTFVLTNPVAIAGIALAGKTYVIGAITDMIKAQGQVCHYPTHAVAECQKGNCCGFQCKDGYSPYPSTKPSQCVCKPPYTECNGKCGIFHGCPSGQPHYKRDSLSRDLLCPKGMSACGIWGRSAKTWECVDTMNDLESCGGCAIPLPGRDDTEGLDCTALPGVSDVSCIRGKCVVHKCTAGYELHPGKASCTYNEDKDPVILAAQYGLEHVPL